MLSVFGDLKHLVRYKKSLINNSTFKLHYKFSFTILCIFSVIQGLNQHLGDPILCQEIQGLPKEMVNTFCWIHGTYIVQDSEVKDNFNGLGTVTKDTPTRNQYWYQWVIFVVFLQAVLCYLPHYLWKIWEGNKISLLIQDLDRPTLDTEGEETREKRRSIVSYLYRASKTHNVYVSKFVFCEFLNLANVIGQLYFMNFFFDGTFFDFGLKVIRSETQEETVQKMSNVFPKIAKCNLTDYGPSGTIQRKDTWCVLPMNNFNGKFYFFLWFWYLAVLSWTTIFLCFRILTIASRSIRTYIFIGRARLNSRQEIGLIMKKIWFGDWFILMQLCKNMQPDIFSHLVTDLYDRFYPRTDDDEKAFINMLTNPS